jgi:hypothetical protein
MPTFLAVRAGGLYEFHLDHSSSSRVRNFIIPMFKRLVPDWPFDRVEPLFRDFPKASGSAASAANPLDVELYFSIQASTS